MTILLVLGVFFGGCGSDEEQSGDTRGGEAPTAAEGRTTGAESDRGRDTETSEEAETGPAETSTSREEEVEGGPGDEVPARVPAMFRVRDGRLRPATVRVPPYIAVTVEVRSPDELTLVVVGRRGKNVGPGQPARFRLDGLRPQQSVSVRLATGATARIVAAAEPGP